MSRCVYVDGQYLAWAQAGVHAEDRGFQFGDGVYEVCDVRARQLVDETRHMDRLQRSLGEIKMAMPMSRAALGRVLRETIRRNRVADGMVYLQVTRGAAPREFLFPGEGVRQTVVCLARSQRPDVGAAQAEKGISVITLPDERWTRVDIKTVMLLASSLAKEAAHAAGADDAWFVDRDGGVTEGASSNAWIVTRDGKLVTRPADGKILHGITRMVVMDLIAREGLTLEERTFSVEEALEAREAFVTSATQNVMPVVKIDGRTVANGHPGQIAGELRRLFHSAAELTT